MPLRTKRLHQPPKTWMDVVMFMKDFIQIEKFKKAPQTKSEQPLFSKKRAVTFLIILVFSLLYKI